MAKFTKVPLFAHEGTFVFSDSFLFFCGKYFSGLCLRCTE